MKILLTLLLTLAPMYVFAQQALPTCEVQLEEAKNVNIQLRKAKAQSDFTAAAVEEAAYSLQKRLADMETKAKAVPPPAPINTDKVK